MIYIKTFITLSEQKNVFKITQEKNVPGTPAGNIRTDITAWAVKPLGPTLVTLDLYLTHSSTKFSVSAPFRKSMPMISKSYQSHQILFTPIKTIKYNLHLIRWNVTNSHCQVKKKKLMNECCYLYNHPLHFYYPV